MEKESPANLRKPSNSPEQSPWPDPEVRPAQELPDLTNMRKIMYRTAITEAMREEMERDERVFIIGEDVDIFGGVYKLTRGLVEKFGRRRVRGTPISEAAFFGLAAGAAMTGLRPIVEIMYMDFALVGMDQLVNQAAKIHYMSGGQVKMPLVVRGQFGVGHGRGRPAFPAPRKLVRPYAGLQGGDAGHGV